MALRKLGPQVYRQDLGPVRMWRDDIAEMVSVFRQVVPRGEINIEVDGYEVDEIEDLAELKVSKIDSLTVRDRGEKLALELSVSRCLLRADDPDLATRGMIAELGRIAQRCRRRRIFGLEIVSHVFATIVTLPVVVLIIGSIFGTASIVDKIGWLGVSLAALFVVVGATLYILFEAKVVLSPKSILFARTRMEAPTFWMRKRDDVWLTAIASLVSLILGGFLGYWINTIS